MFHPVTAELAVQEHHDRMRELEQKAAQKEALASCDASPAPMLRTFVVRRFVGSLFIGVGVWIQGSPVRSSPTAG